MGVLQPISPLSAVAEDTPNAYDDGVCVGAALALLRAGVGRVETHLLPLPIKVEGIDATETTAAIRLLMVTDADDPAAAAELFETTLPR